MIVETSNRALPLLVQITGDYVLPGELERGSDNSLFSDQTHVHLIINNLEATV